MQISPISFGRKIPVAHCAIKNLSLNKPEDAIFYEYDCTDLFDVEEIQKLDSSWDFRELFKYGIQSKFICLKTGEKYDGFHYYCMKNPKGEIIGLCKTQENDDSIEVKLINSKKDSNYKYVAQNMLAYVAKRVLDTNRERLVIKSAIRDVYDFYEKVCGFKLSSSLIYSRDYEMKKDDIPRFLELVQNRVLNVSA